MSGVPALSAVCASVADIVVVIPPILSPLRPVARCPRSKRNQSSPGLWKELAKEVRSSKTLLQGFLKPASTLASIADHRTQELVFEALYRLWKVSPSVV